MRKVKQFADAARDELREELGPDYADLELRDLDPRTIVRKHIIEAMNEPAEPRPPRATTTPPGQRARGRSPAPGGGGCVRSPRASCRRTTSKRPDSGRIRVVNDRWPLPECLRTALPSPSCLPTT